MTRVRSSHHLWRPVISMTGCELPGAWGFDSWDQISAPHAQMSFDPLEGSNSTPRQPHLVTSTSWPSGDLWWPFLRCYWDGTVTVYSLYACNVHGKMCFLGWVCGMDDICTFCFESVLLCWLATLVTLLFCISICQFCVNNKNRFLNAIKSFFIVVRIVGLILIGQQIFSAWLQHQRSTFSPGSSAW